jgi:hypothetical protein
MPNQPLRLRAAVYPLLRTAAAADEEGAVEMAAVLTVRLPAVLRPAEDTLTLIRTAYDEQGRAGAPIQESFTRQLQPAGGDESPYSILTRFSLLPGRHQVRFNATSRLADLSGSVIVEVTVPAGAVAPSASAIILGRRPEVPGEDTLGGLLPIVPTTDRDFVKGDRVAALVQLSLGRAAPAGAATSVTIEARVLDADHRESIVLPPTTIAADAFTPAGAAAHVFDLPLTELPSGLHVLSVTANFDNSRVVRRDVVFRVR